MGENLKKTEMLYYCGTKTRSLSVNSNHPDSTSATRCSPLHQQDPRCLCQTKGMCLGCIARNYLSDREGCLFLPLNIQAHV